MVPFAFGSRAEYRAVRRQEWVPMTAGVPDKLTVGVGADVAVAVAGAAKSTSFATRNPWVRTPMTNTRSPRAMPLVAVTTGTVVVVVTGCVTVAVVVVIVIVMTWFPVST